ncbi:MFS transporter [Pseudomonas sp. Marseille-Q5117]|uniref:MFS transporter n=1 Tax=Pseudomonas sp. Marseille-Q5117 TaxID=2972777 RepID=UPI0021C932C7|nr:MFS transporter [Pseudomonas sp. Marseille-Q5117]
MGVSNDRMRMLTVVLASSLTIMGSIVITPVFPKMLDVFGGGDNAQLLLQLAITGPAMAICLFSPLLGLLSDKIGRKRLVIGATFFYCVLGVAPVLSDTMSAFVVLRILFGCTEAVIMTCCLALIGDNWSGPQRQKVLAWQVTSIGLVGALFYALGGVLGEFDWRAPFYLYALPIFLLPLMSRFLQSKPSASKPTKVNYIARTNYTVVGIGYFTIFLSMVMSFTLHVQMPIILGRLDIASPLLIGIASGCSLLFTLVGAAIWPKMRSSLGINFGNFVVFGLYAVAIYLLYSVSTYEMIIVAAVLHGVASGIAPPNTISPVMEALASSHRGLGMGLFTSLLYLGQFSSPLIIAWLSWGLGGFSISLLAMSIISLVYSLLWLIPRRRDGHAFQST